MSDRRANNKSKHRRPSAAARKGQRAVVLTVTGGMAAGGFIAGAGSAVADHKIVSQAEGYFLSGNLANLDLKTLLPVAKAVNKSHDPASVKEDAKLGINLGNTVPNAPLPAPLGAFNLFGTNGLIDAGVLNEYARANGNGSSLGASGAVTKTGSIEAGTPDQNAQINLAPLLGGVLGTVADLDVSVGALAATAKQTAAGVQSGDYKIADLRINLQSPALATVLGTLNTALTTADGTFGGLGGLTSITDILPGGTTLTNVPDLTAALTKFNNTLDSEAGGISVDPVTGVISINVSNLVNLNDLPPNTDILPIILGALDGLVTGALATLTTDVASQLDNTIGTSTPLLAPAQLLLDAALATALTGVDTAVNAALGAAGTGQNNLLAAGTGGLIGDILDDTLDLVANVQVKAAGLFTERALSVGLSVPVLDGTVLTSAVAQGSLALINLANASVGPNAAIAALAPPVITEPDDGDETTDRTPPIEGDGRPGATVTVREGDRVLCTAKVNSSGRWRCTSARLSLGEHTIVATQRLNGVTSGRSNRVTFDVVRGDGPGLPATGGNGSTAPLAAAALALMLAGGGLAAAPGLARHRGAGSTGTGARASGGRHARR